MHGSIPGYIGWTIVGALIICIGIRDFFSKKQAGFWANAKPVPVENIKGYNRAVGVLFVVYGVIFIALGLPLLWGANAMILLSTVGVMLETIIIMAVYSLGIEKKYR